MAMGAGGAKKKGSGLLTAMRGLPGETVGVQRQRGMATELNGIQGEVAHNRGLSDTGEGANGAVYGESALPADHLP